MKHQAVVLAFVAFIVFVFTGCDKLDFLNPKKAESKKTAPAIRVKGTIIAKVNNLPLTLEELDENIKIYNASLDLRRDLSEEVKNNLKIDTREKKVNYLKQGLVRQQVFYQAALDRGLDRKENLMEILERSKIAILARAMEEEVTKNIDVSFTDIENAYNSNKALFKEPEARKIREIVVNTEDEARQILIELLQGADFASFAKSRSLKESAKDGGDLGYIKAGERGELFAGFDQVAFSPALQKGALSSVFKGPGGYYIVKIEDIKQGKQISLDEAKDTIRAIILDGKQREELDKFYSELSRDGKTKIEIYEGEIK